MSRGETLARVVSVSRAVLATAGGVLGVDGATMAASGPGALTEAYSAAAHHG